MVPTEGFLVGVSDANTVAFRRAGAGDQRVRQRPIGGGGAVGAGGSLVHIDFDRRMTVAYVMNQMVWDDGYARAFSIMMAAYEAITV